MSFPTTSRQPLTTRMVISTSYCIHWKMEAAGAPKLTVFLKKAWSRGFRSCREYNFRLDVYYVPSGGNPADLPSRSWSDADCMLSISAWDQVKRLFGPHTFDLMSLDSNCQRNKVGLHLPHFTPCATSESSGINVFDHSLPLDHNIYVFTPFVLIAPLLRYLLEQDFHGAFTIVVPDLKPRRFWWALLQSIAVDHTLLGRRNQASILWYPSQGGQGWYLKGTYSGTYGLSAVFTKFISLHPF